MMMPFVLYNVKIIQNKKRSAYKNCNNFLFPNKILKYENFWNVISYFFTSTSKSLIYIWIPTSTLNLYIFTNSLIAFWTDWFAAVLYEFLFCALSARAFASLAALFWFLLVIVILNTWQIITIDIDIYLGASPFIKKISNVLPILGADRTWINPYCRVIISCARWSPIPTPGRSLTKGER